MTGPPIRVRVHDEHTVILRQCKSVHYEAPFLFLLFGEERALLLDTGATADPDRFPLRATVDRLIADRHPGQRYPLVVAHSHAHGDHHAADGQFRDRPDTDVVGLAVASVREFFGFADWPSQVVRFDLGGRVLEVTGIPGHHEASIAIFDPWSGILFTGDTVLPGRLYVRDFPAFTDSLRRLVELADRRPVTSVLGCHVEMTSRPRRDYPIGATRQPDERPLPFTVGQLTDVLRAAESVAGRRGVWVFDDFVLYHRPGPLAVSRQVVRSLVYRWSGRLRGHPGQDGDA